MIRCPLCHQQHEDPPDVKTGRSRVCIKCYAGIHQTFAGLPGAHDRNPRAPKTKAPANKAAKTEKGS